MTVAHSKTTQALEIRIGESEQVRWEKLIFPSARSCLRVPLTKVVSFTTLQLRLGTSSFHLLTGSSRNPLTDIEAHAGLDLPSTASLAFPFNFTNIYFCNGKLVCLSHIITKINNTDEDFLIPEWKHNSLKTLGQAEQGSWNLWLNSSDHILRA